MMFILSLIPATFFVALGYLIMQSAASAEGGTQKFGKYLSVWVFVLAALILLGGTVGAFTGMQGMMRGEDGMSRMQGMREMRQRQNELLERLVEAQEGASEATE